MATYKGWSSFEYMRKGTFKMTDVDLVNMDILTHLQTRKGDRIKMSNFGTIIPDSVFSPLTSDLISDIRNDVETVIKYDPRVKLIEIRTVPLPDQNTLIVGITLFYVELNLTDKLELSLSFSE